MVLKDIFKIHSKVLQNVYPNWGFGLKISHLVTLVWGPPFWAISTLLS
jgi:hypothetical protein